MRALTNLLAGIEATKRRTDSEVAGAAEHLPKAIDVLLEMPRHGIVTAPGSADEGMFRFWAINMYVNAAHTCWALFDLSRGGLYYEASILLRNLTEVLVQLRYFESRQSEVALLLDEKTFKKFKFKAMFEAVSPGYYDKWYGLLSGMAHGRLAATLFRTDDKKPAIAIGAEYNEDRASMVGNQFTPLLLGFLRLFPHHFPDYVHSVDQGLEQRRVAEMNWLQSAVDAQTRQFPRSAQWSQLVQRMIQPPTP